jgi:hypothetical protein
MIRRVLRSRQGLVLVSVALVSSVIAPVTLAVTNGPAGAAVAPKLDHFECYSAATTTTKVLRASFRGKPRHVSLRNGLAAAPFSVGLARVQMQCSPARQTVLAGGPPGTTPVTNARARLVCWSISGKAPTLPRSLTMKNQFGTGTLRLTAARTLCLPSWKNAGPPLKFPAGNAPANLDAFVCYQASHPVGQPTFRPPASVRLTDQFGGVTTRVGAAVSLCVPTARHLTGNRWTRIVNAAGYSVCFALPTKAASTRVAYDKNGFGTGAVKATHNTQLCVPSAPAAQTAPPPPTAPTTTAPPPTTTTPPTTAAPTTTTTTPAAPGHWTPSSAAPLSWYWQLQGTVNTSVPAQVYEIDGFNTSAATVSTLHAQGKKVICYIDFGTSETNRPDIGAFPASVQGLTNAFPGERWLDIRQLAVLEPIMTARMQMCVTKGFDALEADNVDGYANATGFTLLATDQLAYNTWIATAAHALGLSVGLKNDNDQTAQLQPYFDWALDEQCNEFAQCPTENVFTTANKAVFNAEYTGTTFCAADAAAHINGALFDVGLDGAVYQPCTGSW